MIQNDSWKTHDEAKAEVLAILAENKDTLNAMMEVHDQIRAVLSKYNLLTKGGNEAREAMNRAINGLNQG